MPLFAIVGIKAKPELATAVERDFPEKRLLVAPSHWVVFGEGTAQTVSDKLGVRGGGLGTVMIYNIAGYYGYASTNVWESIKNMGGEE